MNLKLKVWRQADSEDKGSFATYEARDISEHMSFLEMLDVVNEDLLASGEEPIAFDSDCREGICGTCGFVIDGVAHGPNALTTVCQLHMRFFKDGQTLTIEPFRARAFPVLRDLVVNRSALDRIIQAGGFISTDAGSAPEANSTPVPKSDAETSMSNAECIGCGACVAACPNASAMLFTSAKVVHLGRLPQGQPERMSRAIKMVAAMDEAGFGACTNHAECEAVCPKGITLDAIAQLNRDRLTASLRRGE
jgi:succinate dehydrogenase / fumarate reductase, iron-sulfur subunit